MNAEKVGALLSDLQNFLLDFGIDLLEEAQERGMVEALMSTAQCDVSLEPNIWGATRIQIRLDSDPLLWSAEVFSADGKAHPYLTFCLSGFVSAVAHGFSVYDRYTEQRERDGAVPLFEELTSRIGTSITIEAMHAIEIELFTTRPSNIFDLLGRRAAVRLLCRHMNSTPPSLLLSIDLIQRVKAELAS